MRKKIIAKRAALSVTFQKLASEKITAQICNLDIYQNSRHIAAYHAVNGEIDLSALFEQAWAGGKACYLPILQKNKLLFGLYNKDDKLIKNRFGIPEPSVNKRLIDPKELDIAIIPLVGFNKDCNRIGMGCGYYDRTFAFAKQKAHNEKPILIGAAYEFQKIPNISPQPWDVPLDLVITDITKYERF